jgi:hypothetical protein
MPASPPKLPFSAIFVSPHLDDAILCATQALLTELARPQARVLCLTVFTSVDRAPYSPDALKFCHDSGAENPAQLFTQRRREDTWVMHQLGCEFRHWSHSDAGFRQDKPTQTPLYATFDQVFSGQHVWQDQVLITQLASHLVELQLKQSTSKTRWYAPLGVGNHVDHVITYLAILKLMLAVKMPPQNVQFWLDVPYHHNPNHYFSRLQTIATSAPQVTMTAWQHHWLTPKQSRLKRKLVQGYTSQWAGLVYPGGYDSLDDHYERSLQLSLRP